MLHLCYVVYKAIYYFSYICSDFKFYSMKIQSKISFFFVIYIISSFTVYAQTGRFYTTDKGLSSSLINHFLQDSKGFIWTATEYGLNSFDGLRFTNYWHVSGDSTSIKNNYVRTLFEDSRQNLLIGCIDGLMKYDRETNTFSEIPMIRASKRVFPHVTQMQELHNGEIWMTTTGQGMFRLDEEQKQAVSVDELLRQSNYNFQSCFYEDSYYNLWIGTYGNGLICYIPATKEVRVFKYPALNDNNIAAIIEDKQGNLFVGTQKKGLSCYNRKENCFTPVPYMGNNVLSVYCMSLVDGQLLVGTDGQGLKKYNPIKMCLEDYIVNSTPIDFSEGKIHSILEDKDKNLWLGLFQKGLVLIPKQSNPFEYYGSRSIYYNPIGQGCVMSIFQDSNQHLWIGVDNEGIYELDTDGNRLRHYQPGSSAHSVANTIMCIYEDSEKNLWLGSYTRGIAKLNRRTGECDYSLLIDNEKILSITEDKQKNLYIGTLGSGFYQYNLQTGNLKHYESSKDETGDLKRNELANDWINYIFCDSEGLIWFGHYKGISCFNPLTGSFVNYRQVNTLISGCVGYAIQEDYSGNIWAGTTDGLYCFNKNTEDLERFTIAEGLPNNVICGLSEDFRHDIWISTYMGISRYDAKKRCFVNYYSGDGLQGNEFTHGAFYKDKKGRIYFGGIPGICAVTPSDRLDQPSKDIPTFITGLYVMGKPIANGNSLTLQPDEYDLDIHFSSLDYLNARKIRYAYRLAGLDKEWNYTTVGQHTVSYNHLPHGNYVFEVKATDGYGIWSEKVTRLHIERLPAFYQTGWAIAFYILVVIAGIFVGLRFYLHRMKLKNEELYADSAELMKMRSYLDEKPVPQTEVRISEMEFAKLDEILLGNILKAVEDNLSEAEFDVQHLAEKVNMSRSTLTRKLKAITGLTPLEYIRRVKMQHACRMLKDPHTTVNEVALALGYYNRKYFTSCFKEEYGMTPSEFQKQQEKGDTSESKEG